MTLLATLRRDWVLLFFELVIVVVGITVSFMLQDWRAGKELRADERRLLTSFVTELEIDQFDLQHRIEILEGSIDSIHAAFMPEKRGGMDSKALSEVLDLSLSYINFSPSKASYLELSQSGASRLIQDKGLVKNIVGFYERAYPQVAEWDIINRDFVIKRMFVFVDEHGPAVTNELTGGFAEDFLGTFEALEDNRHFRNLLRTHTLFQGGQKQVYEVAAELNASLVKRIKAALD